MGLKKQISQHILETEKQLKKKLKSLLVCHQNAQTMNHYFISFRYHGSPANFLKRKTKGKLSRIISCPLNDFSQFTLKLFMERVLAQAGGYPTGQICWG